MLAILRAAAVVWLLSGAAAHAESTRAILQDFGFFGLWSPECDLAVQPDNLLRETSIEPSGQVKFTETFGKDYQPQVYVVLAARRAGPDILVLRIELNGTIRQELTIVRETGRLRTTTNRRLSDGKYVVKDGVVLSINKETPWLVKCGLMRR